MNHLVEALVPTFSGSQTGVPKVIKNKNKIKIGGMAKLMNSVQQGRSTLGHESVYCIHEFGHW